MPKSYLYLIAFLFSIAIGFIAFRPAEVRLSTTCNLKKEKCLISNQQYSFWVDITPRPLSAVKDFTLTVTPQNFKAKKITAFVIGRNFDHETLMIPLKRYQKYFSARGAFPLCTEEVMLWRIHIAINDEKTLIKTNLDFELYRE